MNAKNRMNVCSPDTMHPYLRVTSPSPKRKGSLTQLTIEWQTAPDALRLSANRKGSAAPTHSPHGLPENRSPAPNEIRIATAEATPKGAHRAHQGNNDQEEDQQVLVVHAPAHRMTTSHLPQAGVSLGDSLGSG